MYYRQTNNPHHLHPSSAALIGHTDQANHQYDLKDFFTALKEGRLPAVSYLKAGAYQNGHAGYSDPIDEQIFVVDTISALMKSPEWNETAVIIAWDDSDRWYDHQMGTIVNQSNVSDDQLLRPGHCGAPKANDVSGGTQNGRCGFGLVCRFSWFHRGRNRTLLTTRSPINPRFSDSSKTTVDLAASGAVRPMLSPGLWTICSIFTTDRERGA
jgi:hypothetical protein